MRVYIAPCTFYYLLHFWHWLVNSFIQPAFAKFLVDGAIPLQLILSSINSMERIMNMKLQSSFWINCCIQCHNHQMNNLLWSLRFVFLSSLFFLLFLIRILESEIISLTLWRCLWLISTLDMKILLTSRLLMVMFYFFAFLANGYIGLTTHFFTAFYSVYLWRSLLSMVNQWKTWRAWPLW